MAEAGTDRYDVLRRLLLQGYGETVRSLRAFETPQASNKFVREAESALVLRWRECIKRYEESLRRLASGEYGKCENCKREIPIKYLKGLPFAKTCEECKDAHSHVEVPHHVPGNLFKNVS